LFYPILPSALIFALAGVSYWLALGAIAFVLALPVLAIPFFEPSMRSQLFSDLRRSVRRLPIRLG
jgi:hypothetical protein